MRMVPCDCVGECHGGGVDWPDPTPEMRESPEFNAIWNCIRSWDINVPEVDGELYSGATGNHVRAILEALEEKVYLQRRTCLEDSDAVWATGMCKEATDFG